MNTVSPTPGVHPPSGLSTSKTNVLDNPQRLSRFLRDSVRVTVLFVGQGYGRNGVRVNTYFVHDHVLVGDF
jgi:hypothetical protein